VPVAVLPTSLAGPHAAAGDTSSGGIRFVGASDAAVPRSSGSGGAAAAMRDVVCGVDFAAVGECSVAIGSAGLASRDGAIPRGASHRGDAVVAHGARAVGAAVPCGGGARLAAAAMIDSVGRIDFTTIGEGAVTVSSVAGTSCDAA